MQTLVTMKELGDSLKRVPFYPALDFLTVEEDGLAVGVSGKAAYGYCLSGVDYHLFENPEIESFFRETRKFLIQLPEGVTLSLLRRKSSGDDELLEKYEGLIKQESGLSREVVKRKIFTFRRGRFLKKEVFLFLSYSDDKEKKGKADYKQSHEAVKRILLSAESMLLSGLGSLGISAARLTRQEAISEYYRKLNPSLSEIVRYEDVFKEEPASFPRFETLRSRLLLHPPRMDHDSIYLDGFYHAISNLRMLPNEVDFKMLASFDSHLPDESEWVISARKLDQEREKSRLRVKANFARANAFFRISEDHFAREKASQYEGFLREMAERNEAVFQISMSVLVKSKEESALRQKKEQVLSAFPKLGGAVGVFDHFEHDLLFLTHLPLQTDQNQMKFPVLTDALSFLLPLHSNWKGSPHPEILLKTKDDEGLALDLFDPLLPAKHALMVGSTGSGKSFTVNYLLTHFLIGNPKNHAVVIDVGGSYKKLARIFGGSYLEIDCSEEYALNPFPEKRKLFPKPLEFDSDLLAFLTTLLEKMVTENEKLTSGDLRILERAILASYKTFPDDKSPLLQDVQNILKNFTFSDEEDQKRAYHFSKNLSIWTEGRFGKLLNRYGSLSLDSRFLVFDLAKLSHHPELQSILFFVIRSAISRKLDDTSLRKMIVIDEGWRFFNDEVGSRLIEELYRTARKTNGLVLSISQSPEDFLESRASTAILANSYVKYILKLQKDHELLSKFGLNPNEIKACEGLEMKPGQFSELFIKFFHHSVSAKIEPSPLDYWIATTDPEDLIQEEMVRAEERDLSELERLILLSERYPRGMRWKKEPLHE